MLDDKDLLWFMDLAREYLIEIPSSNKLPGMNRSLSLSERIALSYLNASIVLLNRRGLLKEGNCDIEYLEEDSSPNEEDYLG